MLMQSVNFVLSVFFSQIVVMNTENALVVSIIDMYLQALALFAAMIPSGFDIFTCNRGILIADHHIIKLFSKVVFLADCRKHITIVILLVSKY